MHARRRHVAALGLGGMAVGMLCSAVGIALLGMPWFLAAVQGVGAVVFAGIGIRTLGPEEREYRERWLQRRLRQLVAGVALVLGAAGAAVGLFTLRLALG